MKRIIIARILFFSFIFLGIGSVVLFFAYQTILTDAGKFLAPEEVKNADVVILEGDGFIREKAVKIGMELLSSGMVRRMVIVVHQRTGDERTFALANYTLLLGEKLKAIGLKKDQFLILEVPTNHPITFTEARIVLSHISRMGVRRAILLAEGFHTRRSLGSYQEVGMPLGIKIMPYPYFFKFRSENWWRDRRGVRSFLAESIKLIYYFLCGYISLKSLMVS